MRIASLAFVLAASLAAAPLAMAQGAGSAVSAAKTSTRGTTAPVTASGLLLPPVSVGQPELCVAEGTISPSTLRFGILLNFPHDVSTCEMRRDVRTMADLSFAAYAQGRPDLASKLLDAGVRRLCDVKANRVALTASGDLCAVKP